MGDVRNARIQALQWRWEKMRQVIEERGASEEYASVPGGSTGLLTKDYKGKQADTPVYKVDTALLSELRAHERQAAEELNQWKAVIDERKMIDASPRAIELALVMSREELEDLAARIRALNAELDGGEPRDR